MKLLFRFLLCLVILWMGSSCRNTPSATNNPDPLFETWDTVSKVLSEENLSFRQLQDVLGPLSKELTLAAKNETDLKTRLAAQQIAYSAIYLLDEHLERIVNSGETLSLEEKNLLVRPMVESVSQWLYSIDEGTPSVWHDAYYLSNKESASPVDGYFHLMVLLPTKSSPDPEFHVFFPNSAQGRPALVFRKYDNTASQMEDMESQVMIPFDEWYQKGALDPTFPMYAVAGKEIVAKMLEYDTMYLLFHSDGVEDNPDGDDEIAQVLLKNFQEIFKEYSTR